MTNAHGSSPASVEPGKAESGGAPLDATGGHEPYADSAPGADEWSRYQRVLGWILSAAVLTIAVTVLAVGARHDSYDAFTDALERGDVTKVEIFGSRPGVSDTGYSTMEVRWRDGLVTRWSEVTQASSPRQAKIADNNGADAVVVSDDLVAEWRVMAPGLQVVERQEQTGGTIAGPTDGGEGGYQMPSWAAVLTLIVTVSVFSQIVLGPRPWRATRWGWFWLLLCAPLLAVPAYLLLGGPTGLGGRPRSTFRVNGGLMLASAVLVSLGLSLL